MEFRVRTTELCEQKFHFFIFFISLAKCCCFSILLVFVQFMLQIVLYALAFAIMLMLLWFTMVFSPPFTGDCKALSLSTPPPPGDRWCDTSLALCSIDSSVRLTRGLPLNRPSLLLFVSITASWSRLWGLSTALKYALTCLSDLHWWEIKHEPHGLSGYALCGSQYDSHCLVLHSVQL